MPAAVEGKRQYFLAESEPIATGSCTAEAARCIHQTQLQLAWAEVAGVAGVVLAPVAVQMDY